MKAHTKKVLKRTCLVLLFLLCSWTVLNLWIKEPATVSLLIEIKSELNDQFQVFYSNDNSEFTEENSIKKDYLNAPLYEKLEFEINSDAEKLRIDLGTQPIEVVIKSIEIETFIGKHSLPLDTFSATGSNDLALFENNSDSLRITSRGSDPYISYPIPGDIKESIDRDLQGVKALIVMFISFSASVLIYILAIKRRVIFEFVKDILKNKSHLLSLSKNDFKSKYSGSYFGLIWGYVQPAVSILVYWFVFQVGLRVTSVDSEVPFAIWFIAGLIPWFYFSDSISNSINCYFEYSYLVKKVVFNVSMIPMVKLISSLFVHVVFVIFLLVVYFSYGYSVDFYNVQIVYYSICALFLSTGLSYLVSSLAVFIKDLGQLVNIFLQMGLWLTPIMWSEKIISPQYNWVFKLNPMYYVVQGYREALFYEKWFFENPYLTIWFWFIATSIFLAGLFLFRRLKVHFADVL